MKKLLMILTATTLAVTTTSALVSCGKPIEPIKKVDINSIRYELDLLINTKNSKWDKDSIQEVLNGLYGYNEIIVVSIRANGVNSDSINLKGNNKEFTGTVQVEHTYNRAIINLDTVITKDDLQIPSDLDIHDEKEIISTIKNKHKELKYVDLEAKELCDFIWFIRVSKNDQSFYKGEKTIKVSVSEV